MKIENREFEVQVPKVDGSGIAEKVNVMVPVCWDEEIQDWLMTPEAHEIIDNTKARLIGLLLPAQLKELRERHNCTQKEMGELFQVGEKSWTRWESGKHRPSRSINLLICALYDGEISINYLLKRAGKQPREDSVASASKHFAKWYGGGVANPFGMGTWAKSTAVLCCVSMSTHQGKSKMLKTVLHQAEQQSPSPWLASPTRNKSRSVSPLRQHMRFNYQNAELA